jgi:hypothetical protein
MQRQRERAAERVLTHGRRINLVVKARWRQEYKLQRFGLTHERFDQLLAAQGNACGMCAGPPAYLLFRHHYGAARSAGAAAPG